jgi:hypothetical protein
MGYFAFCRKLMDLTGWAGFTGFPSEIEPSQRQNPIPDYGGFLWHSKPPMIGIRKLPDVKGGVL